MAHHSKNSSVSITFTAADSKRQIQSILGKNGNKQTSSNAVQSERKQLLSEKQQLLKEKKKFNEMKRKKLRSHSNITKPKTGKKHKNNKKSDSRNDKIIKEQQKISTEWMKISKEKVLLSNESIKLKKEKLKLSKERKENDKERKHLTDEKKKLQNVHKKWKQESDFLFKQIETKYTSFNNIKDKKNKKNNDEYIEERRSSLGKHINNLYDMSTIAINQNNNENDEKYDIPLSNINDISAERLKLQRMQKAAKDAQKRAEKTLSELYRKKQELKKEQAQFNNDRLKFKRMENEYNQFIKEKQRLKKEKKNLLKTQKTLMVHTQKKSRMQLTSAAELQNEKTLLEKTKNVLQHKQGVLSMYQQRISVANLANFSNEQREYRDLKKKVVMYQDHIDALENQNKILQRKIKKRDKFASNYAEDMALGQKNMQNTKYLISTLRSKVIELQNRNKLLTKLIKRHKNVNDAYQSVSDLKQARKIITKLVIKRDELAKRLTVLSIKLQRRKDLGDKYQTQLYKMYDEDEDESEEEKKVIVKDFEFSSMGMEEINSLYEGMKEKMTELALLNEEMEEKLQDRETELLQYESYANEWDIKHRLGDDRGQALYGKLRIGNEKLQNKLDVVYAQLEKEKAAAMTWQSTIEDRLLGDGGGVGDEQLILINQLKEENKKLLTQIEFNKVEDVKGHKAIAMDINEQFGSGLFNNLQYILMDADLNNDDILKLKIKDKNDEIYKVVLIKQKGGDDGDEKKRDEMDRVLGMVSFEQKNMVSRLEGINGVIDDYGDKISHIVDMLRRIKNSRKILKDAITDESKGAKPKFDLVVSELRQISLPSSPAKRGYLSPVDPHRHHKTMRRFAKTNYRNESLESLDSVYDLSHEDNLATYGMDVEDERNGRHQPDSSVDVNLRISQFNRSTTPAALYYPNHSNLNSDSEQKKKEDDAAQLTEEDVGNIFNYYDPDGLGTISVQELIAVFNQLGVDTSDKSKLQSIITSLDVDSDGIVTRDNFITWWFSSSANLVQFDSSIRSLLFLTTNNDNFQGQKSDELHAFAQYLNRIYASELQISFKTNYLARYFPIDSGDGGHDLLSKCVDGVLLSKMINFAVPNTIDERVLHFRDNRNDNIAPKQIVENLNIVLSSCKAIGVDLKLFEISVEKFLDPSYYEDIIRQILSELSKIHLSKAINLKDNPVLIRLAFVYEDDDMIRSITSEAWLMRWINYQLKRSGEDKKIKNFGKDFRDGSVLAHVLYSVTRRKKRKNERFDVNVALSQPVYARPGFILQKLQRQFGMKETIFVAANDILSGNSRLICLLCAQIFAKFKGMRKISKQELQQVQDLYEEEEESDGGVEKGIVTYAAEMKGNESNKYKKGDWNTQKGRKRSGSKYNNKNNNNKHKNESEIKEKEEVEDALERDIREERDIVNWINEIFSASKLEHKISNLTRDVRDGLILLYFLDLMAVNIVEWDKYVILKGDVVELSRQQCLTNCHYIISLIKKEPFSSSFFEIELIPNDGNDIYTGNKEIIFKICHNLINYHYIVTISQLLQYKATEFDIIHWTNQELQKNKKKYPRFCSYDEKKLHSFKDSTLKSCLYYIDLLLILMDDPRQDIDRDIVIHKNNRQFINNDYTKSECLSNARYALSIARKFGAIFYISPHDLVNVKLSEITMSFVMCIMLLILTKNEKEKPIKRRKNNNDNNAPIVDALQIHLQEQKNTTTTYETSDTEDDEELQNTQNKFQQHGRRKSVLQEYGIITNDSQLQELQDISRQYSTPNIVTPKVPEQTQKLPKLPN